MLRGAGADVLLPASPVPPWSQDGVTPLHRTTIPLHPLLQGPPSPTGATPHPCPPKGLFSPNHMDCEQVPGADFPASPALAGEKGPGEGDSSPEP